MTRCCDQCEMPDTGPLMRQLSPEDIEPFIAKRLASFRPWESDLNEVEIEPGVYQVTHKAKYNLP